MKQKLKEVKIHVSCSVNFFSENRAVYEITSKNVVEPERPQITIWRRVACWISKTTRAQAHSSNRTLTHTHARTHTKIYKTSLFHGNSAFMNAPLVAYLSYSNTMATMRNGFCWLSFVSAGVLCSVRAFSRPSSKTTELLFRFRMVVFLLLIGSATKWTRRAATARILRTSSALYFRIQFSVSPSICSQYNKKQYLTENYGRSFAALGLKCIDCAVAAG